MLAEKVTLLPAPEVADNVLTVRVIPLDNCSPLLSRVPKDFQLRHRQQE